ncbi:hypothetical protein [uncultured Mailhella sp.]|uniref:hypothetical protein n=1 Tax=uncultured Mailhella sp. TaxID=1981031 RepID=UPI002638536A|nr:hypothetical protein [uncultured Mailhella sp.]
MAATVGKLDICNMALGFIGTRTIASPDERTPEAIQCGLYWDTARRAALRDFPYGFAQKRFVLAEKPMPEVYAREWRFCYGLPDGCLKLHRVHGGRAGSLGAGDAPFRIVEDGGRSVILCSVEQALADCSVDVEDVSLWDELFVLAMARRLAALIAVPLLKNNPGKVQELVQLYQQAVPQADGQDASEGRERRTADAWLLARGAW